MDNIDTSETDLDSISNAHQRLVDAYRVASENISKSKSAISQKTDHQISQKTDHQISQKTDNQISQKTDNQISQKTDNQISQKTDHQISQKTDHQISQKTKSEQYVHPSWVSPDTNPWFENDILMIPGIPPGLAFEKHPEWCKLNTKEGIAELSVEQEKAMSCGSSSWMEHFQKQDTGTNKPIISGASTLEDSQNSLKSFEFIIPELEIRNHPEYFSHTNDELLRQQEEAIKLNCINWEDYIALKDIDRSISQSQPMIDKKPKNLIPLTTIPDKMGAVTRKSTDLNDILWDMYTKEDHKTMMNLYQTNNDDSGDDDPRGKVYKPTNGKTNLWESHAWPETADNEYNVGIYDNCEISDCDEEMQLYGDSVEVSENNNTQKETTSECIGQLVERLEEVAVVVEAISGDSKEISKEVAEYGPLLADTNEDVRNVRDDIKKINSRLSTIENTLSKLSISVSSLNSMMEMLVTHLTKEASESSIKLA
jgi:uncharacterized protein YoxC